MDMLTHARTCPQRKFSFVEPPFSVPRAGRPGVFRLLYHSIALPRNPSRFNTWADRLDSNAPRGGTVDGIEPFDRVTTEPAAGMAAEHGGVAIFTQPIPASDSPVLARGTLSMPTTWPGTESTSVAGCGSFPHWRFPWWFRVSPGRVTWRARVRRSPPMSGSPG